jgi:hypothetical protein
MVRGSAKKYEVNDEGIWQIFLAFTEVMEAIIDSEGDEDVKPGML